MDKFQGDWKVSAAAFLLDIESASSKNNLRFRESRLKALADWAGCKEIALVDFRKTDLQRFTIDRRADGISENTIYHDQQTAQMFTRFCKAEGYLDKDPLATFAKKTPAQVQVSTPSVEDLRLLLAAVKSRNDTKVYDGAKNQSAGMRQFLRARETAIVMSLVDTAARSGELLALTLNNYQADKKQLVFPGKSTKNSKTGYVPISEHTVRAIDTYLALRPKSVDSQYLFVSILGDAIKQNAYSKVFDRYVKFAELKHFTLHGLRHYSLTRVAETDFWGAVGLARHADARTTQKYAQHVASHVRDAHDKANVLGEIVGNQPAAAPARKRIKFTGK